jgi:DNA polymerase III delta prime subunit
MTLTYEFNDRDVDISIPWEDFKKYLESILDKEDMDRYWNEEMSEDELDEILEHHEDDMKDYFYYLVEEARDEMLAVMDRW